MAIAATCASCGVRLRFKSEHTGKKAKCRACGEPLLVQGDSVPDHDVFLSYSSKDKTIADAICAALESKRMRCWVAPRDILPGKAWAGAILDAIDDVSVMVLIYSENSNNSPQVLREIDRAISRNVVVVPFRIDRSEMTKEMEYYIAAAHWLDAMDGPMEQHITALVDTTRRLMAPQTRPISPTRSAPVNEKGRGLQTTLMLASIGLSIIAIAAIGFLIWRMNRPQHDQPLPIVVSAAIPISQPVVPIVDPPANPLVAPHTIGHLRNGVALNGMDNYVDCGNPADHRFDLGDKASIETWVRFDTLPDEFAVIAAKNEGAGDHLKWEFGYSTNYHRQHRLMFWYLTEDNTFKFICSNFWTPKIGVWYHLVLTKNDNDYVMYVDGIQIGHITIHDLPTQVNAPLQLGMAENIFALHGALDDVRLWNIALTPEDIKRQMNRELTGTEPGLVGYWPMNETSGNLLKDLTNASNNATFKAGTK